MKTETLEIKRMFDAAPEAVFDAWLEQDQFESWIGPVGVRCQVARFEPKVGGHYHLTMHTADGTVAVTGVFQAIDRPRGFTMTWGMEGRYDTVTTVTVTLKAVEGRTALTLRHDGLPEGQREGHDQGWSSALGKLEQFLSTGKAAA